MDFLKAEAFFELSRYEHRDLFSDCRYVWQGLGKITSYLKDHLEPNVSQVACFRHPLPQTLVIWRGEVFSSGFRFLGGDVTKGSFKVWIEGEETSEALVLYAGSVLWDEDIHLAPGAVVEPGALIKGPTIVGSCTEVRQGAYIRGKCIVGKGCVVGHTTEMKSSVMLDNSKAGHFAYIGDSILGNSTNLGAGTKLANLKMREGNVHLRIGGELLDTGLRKLGAIIGDDVEIGCNSVTNPGCLLGKGSMILPVSSVPAGWHEPSSSER